VADHQLMMMMMISMLLKLKNQSCRGVLEKANRPITCIEKSGDHLAGVRHEMLARLSVATDVKSAEVSSS
jgi:hypothetical protein